MTFAVKIDLTDLVKYFSSVLFQAVNLNAKSYMSDTSLNSVGRVRG